jgi:deoxyadenosine/deoxycytidine kinase
LVKRIRQRSRAGEADNISIDYMSGLSNRYEEFLKSLQQGYPHTKLIVIDTKDKDSLMVYEEASYKIDKALNVAGVI